MMTQIEVDTMHCVQMIPKRLDEIFEQLKRIADALEKRPTYEFKLEDIGTTNVKLEDFLKKAGDNDAKPNVGITWTRNPSSTKVSD